MINDVLGLRVGEEVQAAKVPFRARKGALSQSYPSYSYSGTNIFPVLSILPLPRY